MPIVPVTKLDIACPRMRTLTAIPYGLVLVSLLLVQSGVQAQDPSRPSTLRGFEPGESNLGPAPGAIESPLSASPGGTEGLIGGRVGSAGPRIPISAMRPGGSIRFSAGQGEIIPTPALKAAEAPIYGSLELPLAGIDDGPENGLTLDQAIEILVRESLDLRGKYLEIPQAQADILTAGLRANPLVFGDGQLVPYGQYDSVTNPGGPAQYDVNVSYPVDVSRKRRARVVVAVHAKRVLEAQYQDAVRLEINNLYTAYIDVLAARETVRYAQASLKGLDKILELTQAQKAGTLKTQAEVNQIRIQREAATLGLMEAEAALRATKRALATKLNLPPQSAATLELRGTVHDRVAPPPPFDDLVGLAIANRPDLAAFRLGVGRAQAEVGLANANRFSDVFLLYQPFTYQNNSPFNTPSSRSWALGATVAVPLFDRNQGNIQRARINVDQTRIELRTLERAIVTEVEDAHQEYTITRATTQRIERDLLPAARQVLDTNLRLYRQGEADLVLYLSAQRDYNDLVRQYRDTLARHRRSMLNVNTVTGERLLP